MKQTLFCKYMPNIFFHHIITWGLVVWKYFSSRLGSLFLIIINVLVQIKHVIDINKLY